MKNKYRSGANRERKAVNDHIANGAILSARFASSKCKGKIKADVIAIYLKAGNFYDGVVYLEQYKKSKGNYNSEAKKYLETKFPKRLFVVRKFITDTKTEVDDDKV